MSKSKHDDDLLVLGMQLDDRAGPARRISREQGLNMIEEALDIWQGELPVATRKRSLLPALAVAASLLLALVGGASAARWYFGKAEPKPHVEAPRAAPAREKHAAQRMELPAVTLEAEQPARDEQATPRTHPAPRLEHTAPAHEPSKAEPDDLLQRANRLRAEGRFQSAADTYAQVYERYPRSLSAYAAEVAAASIELEHLGKPDHARKLFESALRGHPKGALDLEARQGLSLSLRDLGRDRDEANSLRALIRDHGESPAARRAESRLEELESAL
jgi:tetratricopeptide (TPR) repeat protein